eukprot:m.185829 g.185829  ORF g.185829 m.185829 type:complete len:186 (+) comp53549_c0_seq6:669-1226(+)
MCTPEARMGRLASILPRIKAIWVSWSFSSELVQILMCKARYIPLSCSAVSLPLLSLILFAATQGGTMSTASGQLAGSYTHRPRTAVIQSKLQFEEQVAFDGSARGRVAGTRVCCACAACCWCGHARKERRMSTSPTFSFELLSNHFLLNSNPLVVQLGQTAGDLAVEHNRAEIVEILAATRPLSG